MTTTGDVSFNPCFNGQQDKNIVDGTSASAATAGFNPCFNGQQDKNHQ